MTRGSLAAAEAEPRRTGYWIAGAGVLGLIALFFDTAQATVRVWYESSSFNHGFAILPIVGYLIWERRKSLAAVSPVAAPWALILVAGGAVVWLLGEVTGTLFVQQVGFLGLTESFVLAVLGPRAAWRLAFPLLFAWFAIPFGEFLVPKLQDITAVLLVWGLEATGIPVYADGVLISIPSGDFEVAEACSGLRFSIATAAFGVLGANMLFRSWLRRAAFMLLALVVPILANGLRAYGIVMLAYLTDHELAIGVDHLIYGWILFTLITFILVGIGWQFRESFVPHSEVSQAGNGTESVMSEGSDRSGMIRTTATGVAAFCIAVAAILYASYSAAHHGRMDPMFTRPSLPGDWRYASEDSQTWQPAFVNPDSEVRWRMEDGDRSVDIYVAYYARQRQESEVVHHGNNLETDTWKRTKVGANHVTLDGDTVRVAEKILRSRQGQRLTWTVYWVGGKFTSIPWKAKLYQAQAQLLGGEPAAAAIVAAAPFWDDPQVAAEALHEILQATGLFGPTLAQAANAP